MFKSKNKTKLVTSTDVILMPFLKTRNISFLLYLMTSYVGSRKFFNRKNRHKLESSMKIHRNTAISAKIQLKFNKFLPIVIKDFPRSRSQIPLKRETLIKTQSASSAFLMF